MQYLRIDDMSPYRQLIGVGGLGTGIFFELEGEQTLGRNESRLGRLLDVRDYCKLHIVIHYVAKLLGARSSGVPYHVMPIGNVGDDAVGHRVIQEMSEAGIDPTRVRTLAGARTLFSVCFQYPDGTGGNITTSNSAAEKLSKSDIDEVSDLFLVRDHRLVALAVPEVPLEVRHHFLQTATRAGAFRAASFATAEVAPARDLGTFHLVDLVSLNEGEAEEFVDCAFSPQSPEGFIQNCQKLLRGSYPDLRLIISAGRAGAFAITPRGFDFCPGHELKVASTAGAGDALLGGVIAALSAGIPFLRTDADCAQTSNRLVQTAVDLGVLLGSYKCQSPHTIHPDASLDSLVEFACRIGVSFSPQIKSLFIESAGSAFAPLPVR